MKRDHGVDQAIPHCLVINIINFVPSASFRYKRKAKILLFKLLRGQGCNIIKPLSSFCTCLQREVHIDRIFVNFLVIRFWFRNAL